MSAPAMIYSNSSRLRGFLGLAKSRPWTGTGAPSSKTFLTLGEIEGVTDLGGLDASTSGWLLARRGHWAAFLVPARNKFRVMFAQGKTPEDWKNLRAEVFAFVVDQTAKRSSGPTQLVCGTRDALVPENPLTTDELHRVRHIPVRSWWAIATGSPQSVMPTTVHIVPTAPGFFVADTVSDAKGWTTRYPNLRMLVFSDSAVTEFVNGRETRQFPYKPETQLVAVRPDNLQTVASVFQHPCPEPFIEAMLEESRVSGIKYRRLSPLVPCLYSPTLD